MSANVTVHVSHLDADRCLCDVRAFTTAASEWSPAVDMVRFSIGADVTVYVPRVVAQRLHTALGDVLTGDR